MNESIIDTHRNSVKIARFTGIWYLTMAVAGILGFVIFHPQIYISNDPAKTLENLTDHTSLARIRLLFELGIVVSQALTAVWFYKLFRNINAWGAWTIGIWGMINSVTIMISAISMGSAISIANASSLPYDDQIVLIQLLDQLITNAWGVGGLFFGLWLIPMGYIVIKSKRMPVWLGRTLIIGGIGYLLNTCIKYMGFDNPILESLVIPATVGEFWMIGYLLIFGIRVSNKKLELVINEYEK